MAGMYRPLRREKAPVSLGARSLEPFAKRVLVKVFADENHLANLQDVCSRLEEKQLDIPRHGTCHALTYDHLGLPRHTPHNYATPLNTTTWACHAIRHTTKHSMHYALHNHQKHAP